MVSITGSPGDFIKWGGREGRLHSSMCDSLVDWFCLWETGIVWHLLCNDHDSFYFVYILLINIIAVWVFVSRCNLWELL